MEPGHDAATSRRTSDTLLREDLWEELRVLRVELREELRVLRKELRVLRKELRVLSEELRKEPMELWEEPMELWEEPMELWEELRVLREELRVLSEELRKEPMELWEEPMELRVLWEEPRVLREELGELEEELRVLRVMREKLRVLREELGELEEELRVLRVMREKLRVMREEPRVLREEPGVLREEPRVLREELRVLREELRVMREKPRVLREELRVMREKLRELREERDNELKMPRGHDRWLPVVQAQGCSSTSQPIWAQGSVPDSPGISPRTISIRNIGVAMKEGRVEVELPATAQGGSETAVPRVFTCSTVRILEEEACGLAGLSISEPACADSDTEEVELPAGARVSPTPNTHLTSMSLPDLRCVPRSSSSSWSSWLSRTAPAERTTFPRAQSLPALTLDTSCEEFTPDVAADESHEYGYSFRCSRPGLYRCGVTGLLFQMEGGGDVVYRTVPWSRRLLARYHKKPAGPLFDIACAQRSVRRLHLPHCEIRSAGGCCSLSVAHVSDEGVEFIGPHEVTETHVVINVSGFSAFGNVKDEDSPPAPVRALVLLFHRPSTGPDPESLINVLLLPKNVSLRDVLRSRRTFVGEERYIETSPHCKLFPGQPYTLSTCPEDDRALVQPAEAEFDCDNYDNFFPAFQVILEKVAKHVKLVLSDSSSSLGVWERQVCLSSTGGTKWSGPSPPSLPSDERLLDVRSGFVDGVSGPVLMSLLDRLLEKKVLTDAERESAHETRNQRDKARLVVDTVRRKGEAASSEMIGFLREVDPFLCEHLGLT